MKGIFLLVFALQLTGLLALCPDKVPLFRYWNSGSVDHFYTTDATEIGTVIPGRTGKHGYKSEGIQCYVYTRQVSGSIPLFRYRNKSSKDSFYTTNRNEIGTTTPGKRGRHGYTSRGIVGYCRPNCGQGTVPLYRYWKASGADHFYTTNINEIGTAQPGKVGKYGYKSEGITCYVPPI